MRHIQVHQLRIPKRAIQLEWDSKHLLGSLHSKCMYGVIIKKQTELSTCQVEYYSYFGS
jgi:hypothetical protein